MVRILARSGLWGCLVHDINHFPWALQVWGFHQIYQSEGIMKAKKSTTWEVGGSSKRLSGRNSRNPISCSAALFILCSMLAYIGIEELSQSRASPFWLNGRWLPIVWLEHTSPFTFARNRVKILVDVLDLTCLTAMAVSSSCAKTLSCKRMASSVCGIAFSCQLPRSDQVVFETDSRDNNTFALEICEC